jgi:hypothetical protein
MIPYTIGETTYNLDQLVSVKIEAEQLVLTFSDRSEVYVPTTERQKIERLIRKKRRSEYRK